MSFPPPPPPCPSPTSPITEEYFDFLFLPYENLPPSALPPPPPSPPIPSQVYGEDESEHPKRTAQSTGVIQMGEEGSLGRGRRLAQATGPAGGGGEATYFLGAMIMNRVFPGDKMGFTLPVLWEVRGRMR